MQIIKWLFRYSFRILTKKFYKTFIVFLAFLFFWNTSASQLTIAELLNESQRYYNSLSQFVVHVNIESKSLIGIDTNKTERTCIIDKANKVELYKTTTGALLRLKYDEYALSYNKSSFQEIKSKNRKYTGYASQFQFYPFINPSMFFIALRQEATSNSVLTTNDSCFILSTKTRNIEFRKSDKTIKSIITSTYDRINKGIEYRKVSFSIISGFDNDANDILSRSMNIIKSEGNEVFTTRFDPVGFSINRDSLERHLKTLINTNPVLFENKVILLDFFYQGCYPCIKSYPLLNQLYNSKDSNFVIIGVDPILKDSLTIEPYIKKYNLKYPVLVGQSAAYLYQYFKVRSYPTYLIIDHSGKVIDSGEGFTKATLKKITKSQKSNADSSLLN